MTKSLIFRFTICFFSLSVLLTSCSKENSEEMETVIEDIEFIMEVTLRGETTTFDAFAAYCNENGIESFGVSNNKDLLSNEFWAGSLAADDFIINYRKDGSSEFTISGATFETTLNGVPGLIISQDLDNDVVIDEANATQVIGSLSGTFIIDPLTGEMASYSATFAAEVDPDIVPILCQ